MIIIDMIWAFSVAVVIVAAVIGAILAIIKTNIGKIIVVFVLGMVLLFAVALATGHAEETKVIIVYYDDNTFLTENGELHKEYGDLVPGDVIDGNKLILQSEHSFFEYSIEGEVVASFLYWEDAEVVYDHFYQELQ